MMKQDAPAVKRPRVRVDETFEDGRPANVAYVPLMKSNLGNIKMLEQLNGPGITGEVIYKLKKHGVAEIFFEHSKATLTVEE